MSTYVENLKIWRKILAIQLKLRMMQKETV
jgi:hypothetical protein